ncbi:non-ribosomal peptide synthetase [Clostridium weizhouense]|uniref:Amino acid adenylation domain-containing protein n=1 Tax=Clostridium weizhouense TaxID=2859781 RepID=A0ABS7ALS1_9CLOT|nr:non-ribosomal peptide synthetase [Clostridium weizhouense]MBW6409614.1 amino acid adenylation domain-containing protein [Clostridium weizhouense]
MKEGTLISFEEFHKQIKEMLSDSIEFNDDCNLIEFGLDSLKIMRLVNKWRKAGYKVTFSKLIEEPTVKMWWEILENNKNGIVKNKKDKVIIENKNMNNPFPLTDVQYAYWIGRQDDQPMGGRGCHAYLEFDGKNVSQYALEKAWNKLLNHHSMLRAKFLDNGQQQIMEKPFSNKIVVNDLRSCSKEEVTIELEKIRKNLSHRKLNIEKGNVAGLELTLLPDNFTRIHFDIDLLVCDVQSMQIILRDLASAYAGYDLSPSSANWNFAQYLYNDRKIKEDDKQKAKEYWGERLKELPLAPGLPLKNRPEEIRKPTFRRRTFKIKKEQWYSIKKQAATNQITPAMVLLTAYAEVLNCWSTNSKFLINVPLFDRETGNSYIEDVVADFTNLLLLSVDCSLEKTFLNRLSDVKEQFYNDVSNSSYSGVEIQRDLARIYKGEGNFAPVVFACNLGTNLINEEFRRLLGDFSYMISQTPQVWLDFQIYEMNNELMLAWDAVEELFPDKLIDEMFSAYVYFINYLADDFNDWNKYATDILLRLQEEKRRNNIPKTLPEPSKCLHESFFEFAKKTPEKIALIDDSSNITLSYSELAERVLKIAGFLKSMGIKENDAVGITLQRGINQIEAILGILSIGAYYVPISVEQPDNRRRIIHKNIGINYVISDTKIIDSIIWPEDSNLINIDEVKDAVPIDKIALRSPYNSAYIILTSGSTGEPKGVEVSHYSAWNTISNLNEKYSLCENDSLLAVSAIDFDLSVYDIFGILSVGGTLVLVKEEERRDADAWLKKVMKHKITIWNSVPILLDMLLVAAEDSYEKQLPFRLVMLSGDWIGLDLPERVDNITDGCRFIAMGGATEAAIWSNIFEVKLPLPNEWTSVPYGHALPNQAYRVVDENGRDCPDLVPGELWIGGAGVAKGYKGNEQLTKEKFIKWNGLRWYKTGDLGRFLSDGNIEFLGRKDFQVKIRGHRIELGEIENALRKHPDIEDAVVVADGDERGNKHLVGYIVDSKRKDSSLYEVKKNNHKDSEFMWKDILKLKEDENKKELCKELGVQEAAMFWDDMDSISLAFILNTLNELRLFTKIGEKNSYEDIVKKLGICDNYKDLLNQWLQVLIKRNILVIDTENNYVSIKDFKAELYSLSNSVKSNLKQERRYIEQILDYVKEVGKYSIDLLRGKLSPLEVFFSENTSLSPDNLVEFMIGTQQRDNLLQKIILLLAEKKSKNKPVEILQIGARNSKLTKFLLEVLASFNVNYTCTDSSAFFINDMKRKCSDFSFMKYELLDLNVDPAKQGFKKNCYDIIIASDSLHRSVNIDKTLDYVKYLLSLGGVLLISEMTINNNLQKVTTAFIEEGFTKFEDERAEKREPLISQNKWIDMLKERNFINSNVFTDKNEIMNILGQHIIIGQSNNKIRYFEPKRISDFIKSILPSYMIPSAFILIDEMPLTSNGKVNRKSLPKFNIFKEAENEKSFRNPESSIEKSLAEIWCHVFNIEKVSIDDDYFELGGDSLVATKLTGIIREKMQAELSLTDIFEKTTIAELAEYITEMKDKKDLNSKNKNDLLKVVPDIENLYEPFPLTDVQYAYWVGRKGIYSLGNVSTHCYFELDCRNINIKRLEKAWQRLIAQHGMMRCVIADDGTQRILDNVPYYEINIFDMNDKDDEYIKVHLKEVRDEMSHQVISIDKWPLFDVKASKFGNDEMRLHISFDNLIFDGWSMFHILSEWNRLYKDADAYLPSLNLSFRDYVMALEDNKKSELYKSDLKYWTDRLEDLPLAPQLPLDKNPEDISKQRFSRLEGKLNCETWNRLKNRAKATGLTSSSLLLTAYAEVLGMWSKNPCFTINLTQFNRLPVHPEVNSIIGDFTTLTLLAVDNKSGSTFLKRAQNLQKQLLMDLDHPYVGGVQVQRELSKLYDGHKGATMPVVFTSGIGINKWNEDEWVGKLTYNITQTPQVWLDHQVIEQDDELLLIWDFVEDLFPDGMINDMFEAYYKILNRLAQDNSVWEERTLNIVELKKSDMRIEANNTDKEIPVETLDNIFVKIASEQGDNIAIITDKDRFTYKEVLSRSNYLAYLLRENGALPDTLIAIVMEKGWEQIVSALGILMSGAAYLPIDPENPKERILQIINDAEVKIILTQSWLKDKLSMDKDIQVMCVDKLERNNNLETIKLINKPSNLAYIIYTSGSTGRPKGVMIEHRAVLNTILDINKRFSVSSKDKILALSNMNFDLSVYDIFGILTVGGAIVIPNSDKRKDPKHWMDLIKREKITLWNTVPAFMQMLIEYLSDKEKKMEGLIRLVLLSGDWIPLDLSSKIKQYFNKVEVISLGGATEASIWSNSYKIEDINPKWNSIPYGKPLNNQKYYILNEFMMDCPEWVPGKLYISGMGLSKGYWHDEEKNRGKFIYHPKNGERIYCTGDLGRYLPDGNIEFLGREDSQVKIGGYRIELGEIEATLKENKYIENAVVVVEESLIISAAVLINKECLENLSESEIKVFLNKKLPQYLIPNKIMILDDLPLNANGKVDRKKIKQLLMEYKTSTHVILDSPMDELEKEIEQVWTEVLGIKEVSRNDDFFICGGDSLKAVRIIGELQKRKISNVRLSLDILFNASTIALLAEKIREDNSSKTNISDAEEVEEGTI